MKSSTQHEMHGDEFSGFTISQSAIDAGMLAYGSDRGILITHTGFLYSVGMMAFDEPDTTAAEIFRNLIDAADAGGFQDRERLITFFLTETNPIDSPEFADLLHRVVRSIGVVNFSRIAGLFQDQP